MGNAAGGVHVGANAGLWQAAVFGFAGLQTCSDGLKLTPNLLPYWRRLSFPVQWCNRSLQISVEQDAVRVAVQGANPLRLLLNDGPSMIASPNREYVAERQQQGWSRWRARG
jgi:kojibiose phosphorylase